MGANGLVGPVFVNLVQIIPSGEDDIILVVPKMKVPSNNPSVGTTPPNICRVLRIEASVGWVQFIPSSEVRIITTNVVLCVVIYPAATHIAPL